MKIAKAMERVRAGQVGSVMDGKRLFGLLTQHRGRWTIHVIDPVTATSCDVVLDDQTVRDEKLSDETARRLRESIEEIMAPDQRETRARTPAPRRRSR